jgi:nitrogen fixation NifU-like protein
MDFIVVESTRCVKVRSKVIMNFDELYQDLILDHSRRPRNYSEIPSDFIQTRGDNPSCGDEIQLGLKINADGDIEDIKFQGQGCSICMASASLMTLKVKKKKREDASRLMEEFHRMITPVDPQNPPVPSAELGDLRLLQGVSKFPQRVKCATLAWQALKQGLAQPSP